MVSCGGKMKHVYFPHNVSYYDPERYKEEEITACKLFAEIVAEHVMAIDNIHKVFVMKSLTDDMQLHVIDVIQERRKEYEDSY